MNHSLRIAVADDEVDMCDYYQDILPDMGHQVVGVAKTGKELIEQCHACQPDLVICDIKMPDIDGINAAHEIARDQSVPFILVSAYHDPELIKRAEASHVLAYLVKPIKRADLQTSIAIARRRFEQFEVVHKEASDLRQALEDRKIIEKAKGILMKRANLDENDAFRRLQKLARNENRKLVDVARMVVTTERALEKLE